MNWLDISLLCLAVIGFVKGLFDGIVRQIASLIALVAAIYFCAEAAVWLRGHLLKLDWFPQEGVIVGSYVIGFLLIVGIVILTGEIVHRVLEVTPISLLNHLAGGGFGLITMLLFISLFFNLLEVIDPRSSFISLETKIESQFYHTVRDIVPTIYPNDLFNKGE